MSLFRNDKYDESRSGREPGAVNGPDTIELVKKAVNGDAEAFGELYMAYVNQIYRYVYFHNRNVPFAEDVTEEIFVKAWKAIASCKGREDSFLPWLYRIARNHLIDEIRKLKRKPTIDTDITEVFESTGGQVEGHMAKQELMEGIDRLPPNQRQVILLKFIQGLETKEIAQLMGKSRGAVRIMQMRALENLRRILDGG